MPHQGKDTTAHMMIGTIDRGTGAPFCATVSTHAGEARDRKGVMRLKMGFLHKDKVEGRAGKEMQKLILFGAQSTSIPLENGEGPHQVRRRRGRRTREDGFREGIRRVRGGGSDRIGDNSGRSNRKRGVSDR